MDGGSAARRSLVEDEVLLKLKVYRSLGMECERESENAEYTKAVVRNSRRGDVHVINIDNKFSKFFYANYLWDML